MAANHDTTSPVVATIERLLESEPYCYAKVNDSALPPYLDPRSARRLIEELQVRDIEWKRCRDRTAVALTFGAGLTPGEIRSLRLLEIVSSPKWGSWKLTVDPRNLTMAQDAPVARWASRWLQRWLDIRVRLKVADDLVFVSITTGNSWSESNLIRYRGNVLDEANVDRSLSGGGHYVLRHTFALRQLARGRSDTARWSWRR